jgi:mono/diheme cytochrome c family protein
MRILMTALAMTMTIATVMAATPAAAPDATLGADQFKKECSACHLAYPAGFLPARSWTEIMAHLDKHFGEDASLTPDIVANIQAFLTANANDASGKQRGFARQLPLDQTPLRITELSGFQGAHGTFNQNTMKRVGSMSNCVGCHTGAASGNYGDD